MSLRAIHNRHNFFSDYWLGTMLGGRRAAGPRLSPAELRKRMRRFCRLVDSLAGAEAVEPARFRERFVRPLLTDVFGYALPEQPATENVYHLGAAGDGAGPPLAVAYVASDGGTLEGRAVRRAVDAALAAADMDHALIVSPTTLRLVRRAGDAPRLSALDVSLRTLRELEDEESLQAAYRLLSAGSMTPGADGERPIDVLEKESREHSARVSSELKDAVFQAAERLVGAFLEEVNSRAHGFAGPVPTLTELRDAAFLALYRLLFILYAEARDERLAAHWLYHESYSLEGLLNVLLETPPEALARNRTRHWERVQTLFRVFNEGLAANLPGLENIPPRGGHLFSEESGAGPLLRRLTLDDRACAEVLLAIATTRPRRGVGRERVSFRELEIEQLGAVYEGLLEYEPAVAEAVRLAVRAGGRILALTGDELVLLCTKRRLALKGDARLLTGTSAERLLVGATEGDASPEAELEEAEVAAEEADEEDTEADEDSGEDEQARGVELKKGAPVRLLRRLEPGTFYFRPGAARKASGSYYTPTAMVDFLVREALGPLAADRSAREIEALRVVDLACGSAHFLVGAARFLGTRLLQAYREELGEDPPQAFAPHGGAAAALRTRWAAEGEAWCKRRVVERCLYGVDLNPAAVQLAQVALWIESLAGDRPLSFFAHHIRLGNSLLGTFADRFDAPPDPRLSASKGDTATLGLFESNIRQRIEAALAERRLIDADLPPEVRADTPEEFRYKEHRLRLSEEELAVPRLLMDLRSAAPFVPAIWADLPTLSQAQDPLAVGQKAAWWEEFRAVCERERFFHWELEFPEILLRPERPGFDAVIGNPPWDKVLPSRLEFYAHADPLLVAFKGDELDARIGRLNREQPGLEEAFEAERERTTTYARVLRKGGDFPLARPRQEDQEEEPDGAPRRGRKNDQNAHEDVAKYFVDRALRLVRDGGSTGIVVPAVVYNGDGCVGIRQYLLNRTRIAAFYAFENRKRIFPIHASYKFADLVARIGEEAAPFDAAFMRQDVAELADPGPKPWTVRLSREELAQLSPSTLALLEFRGPRDQEIVRRMSFGRPTLGGSGAGAWGTRLFTDRAHDLVYNATRDKELFRDPDSERLHSPDTVLGTEPPTDPEALLSAMAQAGYWPVYEGKHVEQYLVGVKPIRWWLSVRQAHAKYDHGPRSGPTLVFRETASSTNQRTCIAALLPEGSAASHTCTGAEFEHVDKEAALSVLNSFCFDFLLRLRSAGTHVSFTYILPVAVPPAEVTNALPRIDTRLVLGGVVTHAADLPELWQPLWDADRAVAEAYGLGPAEFEHILASFPVWVRKRARLAAFYREQLEAWSREA